MSKQYLPDIHYGFHFGFREVPAISSLSHPEETFFHLCTGVRCLLPETPKTCHFHFGELKSPQEGHLKSGAEGWVCCMSGRYCLLVKFQIEYKLFNFTS